MLAHRRYVQREQETRVVTISVGNFGEVLLVIAQAPAERLRLLAGGKAYRHFIARRLQAKSFLAAANRSTP